MSTRAASIAIAALLSLAVSCDRSLSAPTQPRVSATRATQHGLLPQPKALACPSNTTQQTTAEIGPLGGVVSVGGTSISVPAGALLNTVTMTVTVPASHYMEVDISVSGVDHFLFELPATVTVDYSRCANVNPVTPPLTAWWIDTGSGELLEAMPSVDVRALHTVTFTTPHLSGFILAN